MSTESDIADDRHVPTDRPPPPTAPERIEFLYQRLTGIPLEGIPASAKAFEKIDPSINLADPLAIQCFVDEALDLLSDDEKALFRTKFAEFPDKASELVLALHGHVAGHLDDSFMARCFKRIFATGLAPVVQHFADLVNDETARGESAGTVVFVCRNSYNLIQREARYLRQNGYRCFLLNMAPINPAYRATFEECFDGIYDGFRTYVALGLVVEALSPDIFHIQCHMWEYLMGRVVIERRRAAKVVCEFYDITSVYADRDRLGARACRRRSRPGHRTRSRRWRSGYARVESDRIPSPPEHSMIATN